MHRDILKALQDAEFTEDEIALVEENERDRGPLVNWAPAQFADTGLPAVQALALRQIVAQSKTAVAEEDKPRRALPEKPPYLDLDQHGVPVLPDPHDPTLYYVDPETGDKWRWDGKRRTTLKKNLLGQPIDQNSASFKFPYGEPHPVTDVTHHNVGGVLVPDAEEATRANLQGYDWFHQGYRCWVGNGGSTYEDIDPQVRQRVLAAQKQLMVNGPLAMVGR